MNLISDLEVLRLDVKNLLDSLNKIDISSLNEEEKLQQLYDDINLIHLKVNRSFIEIKNGYSYFEGTATETNWRIIRRIWTLIEFRLHKIKKGRSEDSQESL